MKKILPGLDGKQIEQPLACSVPTRCTNITEKISNILRQTMCRISRYLGLSNDVSLKDLADVSFKDYGIHKFRDVYIRNEIEDDTSAPQKRPRQTM